jgi:hypothetical protein
MRVLVLVLIALAQMNVGAPMQVQDPAYPLRLRVLSRNSSRGPYGVTTWGRADLYDGQKEQAVDYEADCDEVVMVTSGEERYGARWKKQDKQLEILLSRMGTGKVDRCTIKTDLKPFIYGFDHGEIVTRPMPDASATSPSSPSSSTSPPPSSSPSP